MQQPIIVLAQDDTSTKKQNLECHLKKPCVNTDKKMEQNRKIWTNSNAQALLSLKYRSVLWYFTHN